MGGAVRPIPIPDELVGPGVRRLVIAPPGGDLTNDKIRPVEALAAIVPEGLCITMLVAMEGDDLDRLAEMRSPAVWLSMYTNQLPPFAVEVADGRG